MWKWIKFSFRVWLGYVTAQVIIAMLGLGFVILVLLMIDLAALLSR